MSLLFSGGRIFDGLGNVLEDHGVMVEKDRIIRVAPNSKFKGFIGPRFDTSSGGWSQLASSRAPWRLAEPEL